MAEVMVEQYKVLGGMLALREFTVADLATFSGVKETTVRTVLGRQRSLVEQRDQGNLPARRGGQSRRYVLRTGASDEIRRQLEHLYAAVPPDVLSPIAGEEASAASAGAPLGLAAAKDILEHQFLTSKSRGGRERALRVARAALENGMAELHRMSARRADTPALLAAQTLAGSVQALLKHFEEGTPAHSEQIVGSAGVQPVAAVHEANDGTPIAPEPQTLEPTAQLQRFVPEGASRAGVWAHLLRPIVTGVHRWVTTRSRAATRQVAGKGSAMLVVVDYQGAVRELADRVRHILETQDFTPVVVSPEEIPDRLLELRREDQEPVVCVLTFDSQAPNARAALRLVAKHSEGLHALVLDASNNPALRNHVLGRHRAVQYEGDALKLRPRALANLAHSAVTITGR